MELLVYLTFTFPCKASWVHVIWKITKASSLLKGSVLNCNVTITKVRRISEMPVDCLFLCIFQSELFAKSQRENKGLSTFIYLGASCTFPGQRSVPSDRFAKLGTYQCHSISYPITVFVKGSGSEVVL